MRLHTPTSSFVSVTSPKDTYTRYKNIKHTNNEIIIKEKRRKKRKRDYPFTTRQNHKDKIVLMYPRRDKSRIRPGTAEVDTTPRPTSTQFASYRIEFNRFLALRSVSISKFARGVLMYFL